MSSVQLGAIESRFADLIWEHEPIASADVVKLAEVHLTWKKSTTYTVLKRLCDKGLFENNGGVVTAKLSRDRFYAMQSAQFVDDTFEGSLPAFLAAFSSQKALSREELDEIRRMIDSYEEV